MNVHVSSDSVTEQRAERRAVTVFQGQTFASHTNDGEEEEEDGRSAAGAVHRILHRCVGGAARP